MSLLNALRAASAALSVMACQASRGLITERGFVTRADVGDPLRPPACRDFQQQQFCSQPLVSGMACASAADCPLGNACNFTTLQCEAVNDACVNNPAGIPNDDPAVP